MQSCDAQSYKVGWDSQTWELGWPKLDPIGHSWEYTPLSHNQRDPHDFTATMSHEIP